MEEKLVRVPFNVELSKKIQAGEVEGKIVTEDGRPAKIVYFSNVETNSYNVLYVVNAGEDCECSYWAERNGSSEEETADLFLEIPEYMAFKGGDVVFGGDSTFIYNGRIHKGCGYFGAYCGLFSNGDLTINEESNDTWCNCIERKATEEEAQRLIQGLKKSKDPRAKEYLKRFFNIDTEEPQEAEKKIKEDKSQHEFKPFDKVLVRFNLYSEWCTSLFSHKNEYGQYICCGSAYNQCIPYNEGTAHLLGTTEKYE